MLLIKSGIKHTFKCIYEKSHRTELLLVAQISVLAGFRVQNNYGVDIFCMKPQN